MDESCCNTLCGTLTIDGDISSTLTIDGDIAASMAIGNIVIRDGTNDYNELENKPSIEDRILEGNKTFEQLGLRPMTTQEVEAILYLG